MLACPDSGWVRMGSDVVAAGAAIVRAHVRAAQGSMSPSSPSRRQSARPDVYVLVHVQGGVIGSILYEK